MKMMRMLPLSPLGRAGRKPLSIVAMTSPEIEALPPALARLPGLGPRSARRAVLPLLKKRAAAPEPLRTALEAVDARPATCSLFGNVDTTDPCGLCAVPPRAARAS